ncbi:MAG: hypothetical protein J5585_10300, partial [Clostridia bacterium]|nr:hypothetical protein [Clostridia bacterium]
DSRRAAAASRLTANRRAAPGPSPRPAGNWPAAPRSAGQQVNTAHPSVNPFACERCGFGLHLIRKDQIFIIDGKRYCDVCAGIIVSNSHGTKDFCAVCGKVFSSGELSSVRGKKVCKSCSVKNLSTLLAEPDTEPLSAGGTADGPVASHSTPLGAVPVKVTCTRCGKSILNDGSLHHSGDKYYCDDCYDAMSQKQLNKRESDLRQELVYALSAVLDAQMKREREAEKKRQILERLCHTECASCGADRPKSALHSVDGKYYCEECFGKLYLSDVFEVGGKMGLFDRFKKEATANVPDETAHNAPAPSIASPVAGKYAEGIDYVLQYSPNDDLYFIEIHDMIRKYLADALTFPGMIGFAVFALTQDEYEMKTVRGNDDGMTALVGRLLDYLPKDRLIATGCVNMLDRSRRENLRLELKNDTMDDGKYQKYRNRRAVTYIKSLDRVYVMCIKATGDEIPSVDGRGYAWLFSKKEYAEGFVQHNPDYNFYYRELDSEELIAFIKTWYRLGVTRFKLNPGTNDRYAEVDRDVFLPVDGVREWDVIGSSLKQLIIRYKQNIAVQGNPGARATAMTMWTAICHELYRSVLFVPVAYNDDPAIVEDRVIHVTTAGIQRLAEAEFKRLSAASGTKAGEKANVEVDNTLSCAPNRDMIFGSGEYHFAAAGEVRSETVMHLRTLVNNNNTLLCAFTDIAALRKVFGDNVRVCAQTYEEIISHIDDALNGGTTICGLVIDPGFNELILSREQMDFAAKEKDAPGKLFISE